ncbi:hypothetical protein MSPP1_003737 [Malassezia sp. CBS 17886]|nr:hypothetical protein MSPP1_003737 [Malassezia sp. CBS 17886]
MDPSDVFQAADLSQVETALAANPGNAELVSLREELVNLIALTKQQASEAASVPPKERAAAAPRKAEGAQPAQSVQFKAGDDCMARYPADGRWYPARIASVGGSMEKRVYSVIFAKHQSTEALTAENVRARNTPAPTSLPGGYVPRAVHTPKPPTARMYQGETDLERERKRMRKERKRARESTKQKEHADRQNAWKKFAAKGTKKGYDIAGDKSMFKTPDDPYAKVGVVGAGRGMTQNAERSRHVFQEE